MEEPPGPDPQQSTGSVLHPAQQPPEGDWRVWLFMGGRGAGKTRAGAEWVNALVESGRAQRIALVGATLNDVREVMIEGPSGLKSVAPVDAQPEYVVSRRMLRWPNGATAYAFSAEDPDSLRGPQFDAAWCDEIGAWRKQHRAWDMMMFGLRLGDRPTVSATTTPRPVDLLRRLVKDADAGRHVAITRATMRDNAHNLAPGFVEWMEERYDGTDLGRQELDGELILDPPGALWTRTMVQDGRVTAEEAGRSFDRVVVAIDPAITTGPDADGTGIIAAGIRAGIIYVLGDASARHLRPNDWAGRAIALARQWDCHEIVAEANQGGEMVRDVLELNGASPGDGFTVKLEHAAAGKAARAQPVASRYANHKVRHVGVFRDLEDEMFAFGSEGGRSPDRVDALVWAVTELTRSQGPPPSIRQL